MLVRILKIMTNRAVQRYFRWSAILASIKTFSDWQYIFNDKNHRIFCITVLTWQYGLSAIYCWPSGSIKAALSLFLLHSELSLVILIFFIIFLTKRSECMWFISYDAWTSLRTLKMVRTGGFLPWNSREPIMTASRNVAHSLERAGHMHSGHSKRMKN